MNIPNIDFPILNLKLSSIRNERKPTKKFGRNIKLVRITSIKQRHSFIVYPEFKYDNKWYKFWDDDQLIVVKMIIHSINGINSGSNKLRLREIKKTIEKWLKAFSKDGYKFKIIDKIKVKDERPEEEDDKKKLKKEDKKTQDKYDKKVILDEEDINEEQELDDKNIV